MVLPFGNRHIATLRDQERVAQGLRVVLEDHRHLIGRRRRVAALQQQQAQQIATIGMVGLGPKNAPIVGLGLFQSPGLVKFDRAGKLDPLLKKES